MEILDFATAPNGYLTWSVSLRADWVLDRLRTLPGARTVDEDGVVWLELEHTGGLNRLVEAMMPLLTYHMVERVTKTLRERGDRRCEQIGSIRFRHFIRLEPEVSADYVLAEELDRGAQVALDAAERMRTLADKLAATTAELEDTKERLAAALEKIEELESAAGRGKDNEVGHHA